MTKIVITQTFVGWEIIYLNCKQEKVLEAFLQQAGWWCVQQHIGEGLDKAMLH